MSTRKPRGMLITFSGIDGSGKTTYSKSLIKSLEKRGVQCKYVYGRLEPIILKPFIYIGRKFLLKNKDIFNNYKEYSTTKKLKIKEHKILSKVYFNILTIDYYIQLFLKVKVPLLLGKNLVCDRYIYDTVIMDIAVDKDYSLNDIKLQIDRLFRFFPKPAISFYIEVSESIAFERKDDTPSIEYLRERTLFYRFVSSEYEMINIDGTGAIEENKRFIEDLIFRCIK